MPTFTPASSKVISTDRPLPPLLAEASFPQHHRSSDPIIRLLCFTSSLFIQQIFRTYSIFDYWSGCVWFSFSFAFCFYQIFVRILLMVSIENQRGREKIRHWLLWPVIQKAFFKRPTGSRQSGTSKTDGGCAASLPSTSARFLSFASVYGVRGVDACACLLAR